RFDRAVDIVQSLPRSGPIQTNYDDKLLLYSAYSPTASTNKAPTEGDIKASRPGLLDVLGRAKWDAWNKRKGLSTEEAERLYVQGLLKVSFEAREGRRERRS
ncbi:acyl-CoA-binding protein, partial [Leucosporidium creatinivorum]